MPYVTSSLDLAPSVVERKCIVRPAHYSFNKKAPSLIRTGVNSDSDPRDYQLDYRTIHLNAMHGIVSGFGLSAVRCLGTAATEDLASYLGLGVSIAGRRY